MNFKLLIKNTLNDYRVKLFFTLLILFLLKCGGNYQKGQFVVNESSASQLANDRGMIGVVEGSKLDDKGNMQGGEYVLYFLMVVPENRFTGLGSKNNNKSYESIFEYTLFESDKSKKEPSFVSKITWDREEDVVNIYDKKLNRKDGNAFLIMFDNDMKPSVKQFKGLDSGDNEEILAFYKSQDKDDAELSKISVYKSPK